jgi:thiamine-phosphate pyrophosphorylase
VPAAPPFRLYLITDDEAVPGGDLAATVARALAGAPRDRVAVQLRARDRGGRALLEAARALREVTRRAGARLLVNDRVDVALLVDADGVHLPANGLPIAEARRLLGPDRLVGLSTHAPAEAAAAAAAGADFVVFGPVYATPSKARYGAPLGLGALRAAAAAARLPVFALGGVEPANAAACRAAGAAGVAAVRAVLAAPDPGAAAARLLQAFTEEPTP